MKNQKETKQDELAAIGIGAMIVFIALILVAAVAAAVIIQTAEKLQQNAQASGDDTQAQMSTKVTLINIVIESRSLGADNAIGGTAGNADTAELFVTFELAPGSEPTMSSDVGYTVICENLGDDGAVGGAAANADTTAFDQGDLTVATAHTGNGRTGDTTATPAGTIANPVAQTLNPGSTYVAVLQINDCIPVSNTDHVAIFTVDGGGNTYEELQYGSSPSLGDVVV
jgi:flagellin FlaB